MPRYSKLAVIRDPLELAFKCENPVVPLRGVVIDLPRVIFQFFDLARCAIIPGWLVTLVYGLSVAAYKLPTNSLIALPMPTP